MKLANDFRLRYHRGMVIFLLPIIIYYMLFKSHIYHLVAGGFIFIYFTILLAFINRYIRVLIHSWTYRRKGYKTALRLKSLYPRSIPLSPVDDKTLRQVEWMTIISTLALPLVLWGIAKWIVPDSYICRALLGDLILTTMIFWKNGQYIIKSFSYRGHVFEYNMRTLRIYKEIS